MSKNFTVKINDGNKTLETIKLNTTKKVVIKVQPNVNYELVDDATQYAPQNIVTKRVGNDLYIAFEGTDINVDSDLVLEGYYENKNNVYLLGMAEDGSYYAYIPESGIKTDAVPMLADQVFAPQVLGGEKVATPLFNPNWLWGMGAAGMIALGAGLAVGSHGGSFNTSESSSSKSPIDDALRLVKAAEDAEKAAEKALVDANADGVISQEEADALNALNAKAAEMKAAADEAVKALPTDAKDAEGNTPAKLQARVNVLDGITVPAVKNEDTNASNNAGNNAGNNEVKNNSEKAVADALEKVKAAEDAEKAAEKALSDANADGIISQAEADAIAALNDTVNSTKAAADAAVKALPEGTTDGTNTKDSLQGRVNDVNPVALPTVTDANNNGIKDSDETAIKDALDKVKAAEDAEKAAEKALADANADGIISQAEADAIAALNDTVNSKKAAADAAVKALPEGTTDGTNTKDSLQGRVNDVNPVALPTVTDANNNGIKDSDEAAIKDALDKVKAAEDAEKAAEKALADANADGIISQAEADAIAALNDMVNSTKAAADAAVKALPEGTTDGTNTKDSLQGRVNDVNPVALPTVTDANNNGIKDSDEAAIKDALDKVKAAEDAEKAAEKALADANADGIISQAEADAIAALNDTVNSKKAAADAAVKALPEGTTDGTNTKDSLQGRVNDVNPVALPTVTDANNNGIKDSDETAIKDALDKVKAAEDAEKAAEKALADANADGIISQAEADAIAALNDTINSTKAAADAAVKALPEGTTDGTNTKDSLQGRVNDVNPVALPTVTDANNNGIKDSDETAIKDALDKVKAAEDAEKAAEKALSDANADGIISQAEADAIAALNDTVNSKKAAADAAVKALPEGTTDGTNTKDSLQGRVNDVNPVALPTVTDANNNGIKDSDEAAIKDALDKVKAAEDAEKAAEKALSDANADGIISQAEADAIAALNDTVNSKKAAADAAVKALPEGTTDGTNTKDSLQGRVNDVNPVALPTVTDANNNGIKDSDEAAIKDALDKVKAAEDAEKAAEKALADANADGIISQAEADAIAALNDTVNSKKAAADAAVKALPEGTTDGTNTKDSLQGRVNDVNPVALPTVTDANNNGIKDSDETAIKDALDKVKAAEDAEKAAEKALSDANADGIISQAEADAIAALNDTVNSKKAAADAAVKALPEGTTDGTNTKDSLQGRVNDVNPVALPTVTDANNNGIKDSDEAAIKDALDKVKAAEDAEKAAEKALADANADGIISQAEADAIAALNDMVNSTKAAADAAVKALPEGTTDGTNTKDSLQGRVNDVNPVALPTVTDANNNGIKDSDEAAIKDALDKVKAAEDAEKAAEKALSDANADGIISQAEADAIAALNDTVNSKKAAADAAVKALPEGTTDGTNTKDSLQGRVNDVNPVALPTVTDANNNGIKDSDEAAIKDALDKVKAAEDAEKAAEKALSDANADGIISQAEADAIAALNNTVNSKKAAADAAVKALPEGTTDGTNTKDSLQGRVNDVNPVALPTVTDANNNGIKDSDETAIKDALDKVKAAEDAEKAAEKALSDANADGIISQAEADAIAALNDTVNSTKAAADAAVKALPEGTTDGTNTKDSLQGRVNDVNPVALPTVTDANNNGIKDSDEAAIKDALDKVKAAEDAEKAAEKALADANADGIISQAEADAIAALNDTVNSKKAAADAAVKALPEGTTDGTNTKDSLQGRVNDVNPVALPTVTDANNNGIKDSDETAIKDALDKVKAAEDAEKAAEKALADANADGIISQAEADAIAALNDTVNSKKAAADAAVKALPEGTTDGTNTKDSLQGRVNDVNPVALPTVTDANNNGIKDSDEAAIKDALDKVKAAEDAEKAAEKALADANADGIISQAEADAIAALNDMVNSTKAAADAAVKALPEGTTDGTNTKDSLQGRVNDVNPVALPTVTDANNNGIKDSDEAAIKDALDKVKAAEDAEKAAEKALADANADGIISQAEADAIAALNDTVNSKKAAADAAVKALPEGTTDGTNTKDSLQGRVNDVNPVALPTVTDANNNGIKDSDETAIKDALDKVKAAEDAEKAAEKALADANADGIISQAEADAIAALNDTINSTKAAADAAVKALPEGTTDGTNTKDSLQGRVNDVNPVALPTVTDANNNGIKDSDETAIKDALDKVKAAEDAEKAAEKALSDANADGIISQAEADAIAALNNTVNSKKAAADAAVKALPEGTTDGTNTKDSLQGRVNDVNPVALPTVTDANNNGIKDSDEAAIKDALDKVKAAEDAEKAAEKALSDANADGIISQAEADAIAALNDTVNSKKAAADAAVKALPEGTTDGTNTKDSLQGRVNDVNPVALPTVTDANNNGIKDSDEAAIKDALDKVKAAEDAEKAAEKALADANADGIISQAEADAIAALNDTVNSKKAAADAAVKALPEGTTDGTNTKDSLQGRVNDVNPVALPTVTDANNNGIKDSDETAIKDALDKVKAAEDAEKAAEKALSDANADGIISQAEADAIAALNDTVNSKKAAADAAVKALPEGTTDGTNTKDSLQGRVNDVNPVALPTVTDANNNGIKDSDEAAIKDALDKVKAAEDAEKAAEKALADANADGIISQAEADAIAALNDMVNSTKAAADAAVKALPEGTTDGTNTKDSLQGRVNDVNPVALPTVTDANNNGIKDSDEAAIKDALDKVKAAEDAEKAAEKALSDANADGIISQAEADAIAALNDTVNSKKAAADAAVKALPEGTTDGTNTKDSLQGRVNDVNPVALPTVTDANNNGIKDSDEAAIKDALDKVKAAEDAEKAAEKALSDANADGIISQAEADAIAALNDTVNSKKAAADAAVKALPEGTTDGTNTKDSLQGRVNDVNPVALPTVTDANNNGIKDSDETAIKDALDKVKAAEDAEKAAEKALADANADGIISQAEADAIAALNDTVNSTKAAADAAVKALPEGTTDGTNTKDSLQGRVNDVNPVALPTVTDANNNGIKDSDEAAIKDALDKVKAAEDAEKAAEKALADANADGIISQAEADAIAALNDTVNSKKAAADAAVKALPEGTTDGTNTKDSLQGRVNDVNPVALPTVTDANNNGIKDSDEAAIKDALDKVKAAEDAEKAAEKALSDANADGIISQAEADAIAALNDTVNSKKAAADAAVKALPEGTTDGTNTKDSLQGRVNDVNPVALPTVTDANNNGIKDSDEAAIKDALDKVKAAEDAEKAAEKALADANADGIISQAEADAIAALNDTVNSTKAAADAAVKALPEGTTDGTNTKDSLQGRVNDVNPVALPTVTDANNNGIKDSDEAAIKDALDKVKAAEDAEKAAEKALSDANADGIISQAEADAIAALNDTVNSKKAAADAAVKALPEGTTDGTNTKDSLQGRVNDVNPVALPTVTDANNNGIKDSDEAAIKDALDKVKAAEDAEKAAEKALADANADGIISQKEADNLTKLNAKVAETKAAADAAVKALPEGVTDGTNTKDSLQGRVNDVNPVAVPAVTEAKVTIDNYTDNYGSKTGTFGTDTKTDDNTPTINGKTTLPSSTVHLYEINLDGVFVKLGSTTANASGEWSYEPTWLTNRKHNIYASSTEITAKEDAQSSIVIDVEGVTTPPTSVGNTHEYWSATTVGDINGDGYDDIGMGSWIGNKADAILGGKNLTLAGNNYIGSAVWHQAGVGDVNGDGYNDVLFGTAAETGGMARLYTGGPVGLINTAGIGNGIAAAAGDVNGDGIVDMIVMGDKSSTVYYGSTNGSYTNKSGNLSFGYNSAGNGLSWGAQQYAAGVGDFNGDGYNDVVTTNGIYFGSATGLNNSNKISFNHAVTSANVAGDVNGDGYADVVVVDGKYGNSYVLFGGKNKDSVLFSTIKGNGSVSGANGGFAISTTQGSLQTAEYSNAVGVGDVNGDGLADVLITTYGNTGSGSSAKAQYAKYKTDSYIVYGKADPATVDPSALGKKGIIVPNNQADGSSSVGMVDVNGDGLADIYVNSYNTSGKLFYGGSSLGAEPTVQGSGVVRGNEHSNFIAGSQDNDTIYGEGGADIIYAGSGDDRIVLNADNLRYLSEGFQTTNADNSAINEGKGRLARIDGGNGHNTLAFDSDVTEVDLTKIDNAGTGFMKTAVGMSRIANIDHIDLTNGGTTKLVLEAKDVLDMNPGLKSYTSDAKHQLMVSGEAGDTVTIKDVGNWNQTPTTTSVNGQTYNVYTSTATNGAQLLVETDVSVEFV